MTNIKIEEDLQEDNMKKGLNPKYMTFILMSVYSAH